MSETEASRRTIWAQSWDRYSRQNPSVNLGSSTVVRVVDSGKEDPDFKARPVGFTAQIEPTEIEPLLWDGDSA